jgi:hypothetical protein
MRGAKWPGIVLQAGLIFRDSAATLLEATSAMIVAHAALANL